MYLTDTYLKNFWIALKTFAYTILFFYSHPSLVLVSLVPSSLRAFQMSQHLATPWWMEAVVGLARVGLFLLIIVRLSKSEIRALNDKTYWERLGKKASKVLASTWPKIFIAQLIVFIVCLYGLMNLLILAIVDHSLSTVMGWFSTADNDPEAFANAYLFFLKNMSVIPLSMVHMLKMLGVGVSNANLMPLGDLS